MKKALCLIVLWLTGCATSTMPNQQIPLLRLSPAQQGSELNLTQRLSITRVHSNVDNQPTLDVLLEIDAQRVHLAGFALNQRILTLSWDGQQLKTERHPLLPAVIDGAHILRDIQLIYWPLATVAAALPAGWTLSDQNQQRTLRYQQKILLTIRYDAIPHWNGRAVLENQLEGYRLQIDSQASPSSI